MRPCADDGLPQPGVDALRAWIDPVAWWDRAGRVGAAIAVARPGKVSRECGARDTGCIRFASL